MTVGSLSAAKSLDGSDDGNCTGKTPAADAAQRFASIASGGTTVLVRGVHLSCLEKGSPMRLYLTDRNGVERRAECKPRNDSCAECVTPRMAPLSVESPLAFVFAWAQRASDGAPAAATTWMRQTADFSSVFVLYPDPEFAGFDVGEDLETVTINGRGLRRGYAADDDLAVECDRGANATACTVVSMADDRIVCRCNVSGDRNRPGPAVDRVRVSVGESLAFHLHGRRGNDTLVVESTPPPPSSHLYTLIKIACFVLAAVLLFAHLVGLLAICRKMVRPADDYENDLLEHTDTTSFEYRRF